MQKAAQARLQEGEALVALGDWDGGIDLLGYVAEIYVAEIAAKNFSGVAAGQGRRLFRTSLPKNHMHDVLFREVFLETV